MTTKKESQHYAAELGKRGGKARAKALSSEQRTEIAKRAAQARWGKQRKTTKEGR